MTTEGQITIGSRVRVKGTRFDGQEYRVKDVRGEIICLPIAMRDVWFTADELELLPTEYCGATDQSEIAALTKQRDELLAALKRHDFDDDLLPGEEAQIVVTYEDQQALRQAIANAEAR